jgi:glycerol-3-phosphate acyltransferase PlsY
MKCIGPSEVRDMIDLLLVLISYLLGSIPSGFWFGKLFKHRDVRDVGTKSTGAVNTFVFVGMLPGVLTLAVDMIKGALSVHLAHTFSPLPWLPMASLCACILGHNYSVFMRFRGGKGLASLVGATLYIWYPGIFIIAFLIIMAGILMKDFNVATGLGIFFMPPVLFLFDQQWYYLVFGTMIATLIMIKYRSAITGWFAKRHHPESQEE